VRNATPAWTGLPPIFWALFAGVLVMALATFVFPFLALFLRSRGYADEKIGLLVSLYGAGSIPAGPLAGWLADRVGRRVTLLGSLLCAASLTAALPLLATPALVGVGTFALGLAVHAYYPAANAIVADVVQPDRYNDAFGLMYWERNLGIAISFALGGALAVYGYDRLFLADAATTLAFAAVVWWKIPETRPVAPVTGPRSGSFRDVFADGPFCLLLAIQVAFSIGLFQFMVALPLAMAEQGLSPAVYGGAMAVNGVLIALLSPWASRVTATRDAGRTLALAAVLVAVGYGAYAFCTTPLQYAGATAIWSLGEIITVPRISSLVASLSPPELRGRYQGLFSLSFGVSLALAPAIGGAVVGRLGETTLWAGVSTLCLLVSLAHLAAGRARAKARASRRS
jgi:MFS family permease